MNETPAQRSSQLPQPLRHAYSPFVPLLLLALTLVSWFAFQTYQLVNESRQLTQLRTSQDAQVESAGKVRASLDTVAAATQRFSDAGNPSARLLIDELRKRGITVNTPAVAAAGKPATP
jgi:hypothetical protein